MYSIVPTIEEKLMLGGDVFGITVIDITTKDTYNTERKQREIRLTLYPLVIEISHHHKRSMSIGLKISRYVLRGEFQYGILKKL